MARRATPHAGTGHDRSLDRLLVRSGRGDRAAFTELYDRLAPRVFGLVTCLVRDDGQAQRITVEAFVEAWRRAATYDPASSSAVAWTVAITRRIAVPASRLSPRPGAPTPASDAHHLSLLASGLTPAQADAVQLAWFDGLDHRRIETAIVPEVPVTSLITGALKVLAPIGPR